MPDQDPNDHQRPDGVDDLTVEAVGKLSEALETVERARGHLYTFHQLTGKADFALEEAVGKLREAGHTVLADRLERDLVGRNVLPGRWTFQIMEEYDETYWQPFRDLEQQVRTELTAGIPHLFESELKEKRRTHGHPAHDARPGEDV
jgi:hypothetical protein